MAASSSTLTEGATIGRYRVLTLLGRGGMGAVYVGEHTELRHKAAIKVLLPSLSKHDEIVRRFYNEALAATQVKDPGVVQVFDFDHHTDGRAFIVMELLDGEPMDKRLARIGNFDLNECLRLMWLICTSLGAMHAKGIVHRDLKPENIFLVLDAGVTGGERTKILDFGIAKLLGERNTQTGLVMGTPAYMSPEQIRGVGNIDHRSDIYSIGCVMFTMLTGRPPFGGPTPGELNAAHLDQEPPRASLYLPTLPYAVDEIPRQCMRKRPAERFQSMAELVQAIEASQLALQRPNAPDEPRIGRFVPSPTSTTVRPGQTPQRSPESRLVQEVASPHGSVHTTVTEASGTIKVPSVERQGTTGRWRTVAISMLGLVGIAATVVLVAFRNPTSVTNPPAPTPPVKAAPKQSPPATTPDEDAQPAPALPSPSMTSHPDPPPTADKTEESKRRIVEMLRAFVDWAKKHPGAPCPSALDLAKAMDGPHAVVDPWGNALSITCTKQPENQVIGVSSAGPDGKFNNSSDSHSDDIHSWELDSDATRLVTGARWRPVRQPKPTSRSASKPPAISTSAKKGTNEGDVDSNGIPTKRD